jgi:hypothetical protein
MFFYNWRTAPSIKIRKLNIFGWNFFFAAGKFRLLKGRVVMSAVLRHAPEPAHPRYVIVFAPGPGVDAIRSLRLLLKVAKRRFGLVAVDAYEDRSSALPISNEIADAFRELRDEVVAERAQAFRQCGRHEP